MKFLCRNCKAKYQIADDKVAGRTLRMTCQQCGEPIVVRSPARAGQVSRPIIPVGTPSAAQPSALGADFQRQLSNQPREVAASAPQDEWHVAIHDVPVGPMRRDEVARKIALNAIDRESLAWREGMDDWLPIRHIPELAALFPMAAPPAAAISQPPAAPPSIAPPSHPQPPAPQIAAPPAARVDMAPVGSRQVMSLDDYSAPMEAEQLAVAVQQLAPESSAGSRQPGWAQMFLLVSGGAFILALGAILGVKLLAPQPAAAPVAAAGPAPVETVAPKPPAQPPEEAESDVIELDMQPIDGQASTARRGTTTTPAANGDKAKAGGKELTAEQKELLARMGGGFDQGPNLKAPTESARPSAGQQGQLTAAQLSAVVLRGRKNLQRCYETALRGSQSGETVRLDVEIEVSPNGNVTVARASGKGLPGMDECITRTVKMWRFPSSGEATQTRFPVVFQPGG